MVRMNGLDLRQFQFDYDQTWSAMFLRSDGTVLARYGSRDERGPMATNSVEGLKRTMHRVLAADMRWPEDQESFRHKKGPAPEFARVEQMPSETIRKITSREKQASCVHCHNVYDAQRDVLIDRGQYDPRKRWKYPQPRNIGLVVDPLSGTEITRVLSGSPAEEAGIRAGDELVNLHGQSMLSLADIQFVLHFLPSQSTVTAKLRRGEVLREVAIELNPGWRATEMGWRASMYGMPPSPGLWVQTLSEDEKRQLRIPSEKLALKVRGVFGRDVRQAGLKKNDIVTRLGGRDDHLTHGQFHAQLRLDYYRPNAEMELSVLRDGRQKPITVRFANK